MRKSQWVVLCLGIAACGAKTPTKPSVSQTLTTYVAQASAIGSAEATAVVRTGTAPAAGSGPSATVSTEGAAVSNSANVLTINGSAPFRTVYLSMGGSSEVTDYLQIELPSPQTSVDVRVRYATTLPSGAFDLLVQLAGADGSVGPIASTSKTPTATGPVVVAAVVYSTFGRDPNNHTGPGIYGPPVAGARVSSSLDSATTTTNANGVLELRTNTPYRPTGQCFTLTISAPGFASYSTPGWKSNGQSPDVQKISLSPPMPSQGVNCS